MTLNSSNLFKLYFLSLIVGSMHIFGIWLLLIPLMLGLYFLYKYRSKLLRNKALQSFILITIFSSLASVVYKGNIEDLLHSLKTIILLLSNAGIVLLLMSFNKKKLYNFTLYMDLIVIVILLIFKFMGYSTLDTVHVFFASSSYHSVSWILLLINSVLLVEYSIVLRIDRKKLFLISYLVLIAFILLQGRTEIAIGVGLFAYVLYKYFKVSLIPILIVLIISMLFNLDITTLGDILGQQFGGDAYERGTSLGPREFIWGCYYEGLKQNDLLFGFNQYQVAGPCIESIGFNVRTESSFLSLVSEVGLMSMPLLLLIVYATMKNILYAGMLLPIFLAIILRVSTGDYLFFTIHDWIILYLAFGIIQNKELKK